jgi:pilus assembly protein CpaC
VVRAAFVSLIIIAVATAPHAQSIAPIANTAGLSAAAAPATADPTTVQLLVGRSTVLNVGTPIARVSLTTPDVADALVTSPQQVLIHGKTPGTISLFVWDRAGAIRTYEVVVQRDLSGLGRQYKQLFPGEAIAVSGNGKDVVISGTVTSKYVIDKATEVATGYVEKKENVVNLLQLQQGVTTNQVLLRVRFAEVSRTAMQELGASFFTQINGFNDVIGRTTTQMFPAPDFDSANGGLVFSDFLNLFLFHNRESIGTVIKALQTRGLFQSLAEPNLVAQSGKEASFLAGGEFPYPVVQGGGGIGQAAAVTIIFKEFGVRLNFTPTIMSNDLIHLKVRPEVSSLDFSNALTVEGFRIPALSTRRTETEVELRDGQTFAIAGLMNSDVTETMQKIPGIGDIPILGLLFRSRALRKGQTELVVMITPQIVRADAPGAAPGLPNMLTPFISPPKKTLPPPAPYGTESPRQRSEQVTPPAPQPTSRPAVASAQGAATNAARANANPAPTPAPATAAPSSPTAGQAASQPGVAQPSRAVQPPMDKKAAERLRKEQEKQREVGARRRAEEARAAKEAEAQAAQKAEEDRKRDEKLAREQAKRDAGAARRAAEDKKKQDEEERKRDKARLEAEARLRAAKQTYQQELERIKKD